MTSIIPFCYTTIDGEDPCRLAPFTTALSELYPRRNTLSMPSTYSTAKQFSIALICDHLRSIADEALSQVIGCFVSLAHVQPYSTEFETFASRLRGQNNEVIPKLGFEIWVIYDANIPDGSEARRKLLEDGFKLKERLVLCGFPDNLIRVDIVDSEHRLVRILDLRLINIARTQSATTVGNS
jgi:hypothetical protein